VRDAQPKEDDDARAGDRRAHVNEGADEDNDGKRQELLEQVLVRSQAAMDPRRHLARLGWALEQLTFAGTPTEVNTFSNAVVVSVTARGGSA
jgi:hypothetical protein